MTKGANKTCWPNRTTQKLPYSGDARSGCAIRREVGMALGGWLEERIAKERQYTNVYISDRVANFNGFPFRKWRRWLASAGRRVKVSCRADFRFEGSLFNCYHEMD